MGDVIMVDDLIYHMDGATGTLRLVKATPDQYTELASVDVVSPKQAWAPLVYSDGILIVRSYNGELKALKVSK